MIVYVMISQFAVNVLFPIEPDGIVTVLEAVEISVPVHPAKSYPALVGLFNVIAVCSTV